MPKKRLPKRQAKPTDATAPDAAVTVASLEDQWRKERDEGILPPGADAPAWQKYQWIETSAAIFANHYGDKFTELENCRRLVQDAVFAAGAAKPEDRPKRRLTYAQHRLRPQLF